VKSTRTYLAALFLLTTIGTAVLAYQQYLQLIALKAKLGGPNAGLEKQLADDEKLIKSLRAQLAALGRGRSVGSLADGAGPDGAGGAADQARGGRGARGEAMRAIFNSPQFQALRAMQEKAQLDARYAALFKQLNLNPAQVDQLKNLLVAKQQAAGDAYQAAIANGINPRTDPTAFQAAVASAQSDADQQIQTALGDSGYAQYQQYQQTMPERTTATQLQTALSYSSTPLTDAQSQQLVALMQTEASSAGSTATTAAGGGFGPGGGGQGGGNQGAAITADTISQAASFLSATQVQALQQLQATQQAQQQMQQLMRSANQNRGTAKGG